MLRFLIPWVLASGLIGYLGRRRVGGFWGVFLFALILSPFVAGLSLLISGPGKRYREEQKRELMQLTLGANERTVKRAAAAASPSRGGGGPLVTREIWARATQSWLGLILLFAVLDWAVIAKFSMGAFRYAIQLSLDAGTLGLSPSSGALLGESPFVGVVLTSLERVAVLSLLVTLVSALVAARQHAAAVDARAVNEKTLTRLQQLESIVTRQQEALDHVRGASEDIQEAVDATQPAARTA